VITISEVSRSCLTVATVFFLPSSVEASPRAPPKTAVLEVPPTGRAGAVVKAAAEAAKPNKSNDCFIGGDSLMHR
jgi:hypothetical protein